MMQVRLRGVARTGDGREGGGAPRHPGRGSPPRHLPVHVFVVAPTVLPYFPAAQGPEQAADPEPPDPKVPAGHAVQVAKPPTLNCPAAQLVQDAAPADEKVPAGQAAAVALVEPAGQKNLEGAGKHHQPHRHEDTRATTTRK